MLRIEGDRRRQNRISIERPCKIHDPRTGKYVSAVTCDLSESGLLIDVPRLLELKPGDKVFVGVAMTRRQALLHAKEMMEASVVRALPTTDDHTQLAVRFDSSADLVRMQNINESGLETLDGGHEVRAAA
jgi:hypothetical protein